MQQAFIKANVGAQGQGKKCIPEILPRNRKIRDSSPSFRLALTVH
ncbi:hypothetical protein RGU70_11995 [Herbaspirillum sp. RTI4]|nr:hypothetical protein [Herbaspirillum sp. RTI4]MDY7579044.1 hypothetical protein [Herbaspirillum sp. RTI4]MEA9982371.1 hypothetical protein [Herbaspirillum sp. RTI4]